MIKSIILIRIKQIYRAINDIGLGRFVFLIVFFGILVFVMLGSLQYSQTSYYIVGGFICMIFLIQLNRQDKTFLKTHFDKYRFVYFAEYILLASPIILCLIYYHNWLQSLFLLIALLFLINLDFKKKHLSFNSKIQRLIPENCFEWKGGIRKTLFVIIILWIVGMGTSFFIGSVPVIIFILGIITLGFYSIDEPLQMILSFEMGTNQFLKHKIKTQLHLFTVLSFPLILSFLIFHYEYWYIPVIEYVVLIFIQIYLILTKYAFYIPNQKSSPSQIFVSIGVFSMFLPFLIPLVWILSIYFYLKSKKNLKFYLNDYN